jgi:hypothetical protein
MDDDAEADAETEEIETEEEEEEEVSPWLEADGIIDVVEPLAPALDVDPVDPGA